MNAPIRLILAGWVFGASVLHAQVSFSGAGAYTQNFDTLPSSAGPFTFENNSTLAGWYVSQTSGQASNGATSGDYPIASSGARVYSWGTGTGSDRALGYFNRTGTAGTGHLGLQLQNTSGGVIDSITLSFDVEQWRRNADGATLSFAWLTTSASGSQLTAGDYTTDARGGLTTFATATSGGGLDGNNNRQNVSFTLTDLNWQAGEYLWLRWSILDSISTSAGIGIDNLTISTIPEPSSAVLLSGVCGLLVATAARRRR